MLRAVIVIVVLAGLAGRASADDEIVRGAVVRLEAKEIYVSVGSDRGVAAGAALRIKRSITLHHPVTRAAITDWVPVGSATVTQAGTVMSRAVVGDLINDIRVGDVAEVLVDRPDAPRPATDRPAAPTGPVVDPVTAIVLGEFAAQANQPLDVRIAGWEHYLSANPGSPYAAGVRKDLDALHALREQMRPANVPHAEVVATVAHNAASTTRGGVGIPVVFVLDQPERVASAYLHYKPHDARTYRRLLLVREHEIYLRGTVPAEVVATPGVDYFVEVSTPEGRSGLALASPAAPVTVAVSAPPLLDQFGSTPGRSSVRLTFDALDFRTLDTRTGDRTDRMVTGNVDFTYRLSSVVESLGVGYGVYAGTGGFRDAVWTDTNPAPSSAFQYGYADVELGGHADRTHLSIGGQLIAGVGKTGFGLGAEGRFRIGERDGTNLLVSARTIDQVGALSEVKYTTHPVSRLGVGLSVGGTNQPNRGEIAAKLGTELEILALRNMSLLVRGSWQGRSTEHGGLGGGGGVMFTW